MVDMAEEGKQDVSIFPLFLRRYQEFQGLTLIFSQAAVDLEEVVTVEGVMETRLVEGDMETALLVEEVVSAFFTRSSFLRLSLTQTQ